MYWGSLRDCEPVEAGIVVSARQARVAGRAARKATKLVECMFGILKEGVIWKKAVFSAVENWGDGIKQQLQSVCWTIAAFYIQTPRCINPIEPSATDHNAQPAACHHVYTTTTGILLEHWHHMYPRRALRIAVRKAAGSRTHGWCGHLHAKQPT
jgi:hypothetical protein